MEMLCVRSGKLQLAEAGGMSRNADTFKFPEIAKLKVA
jgi:hypothetical protein